ncbi:MAG: class I SAM-dependent methyltransferase [Methylocystis sp.]|jgi:ubiquinone/menaquinone biosynthesis C-methylase UbiE
MQAITLESVKRILSAHIPLYTWRLPVYQYVMLSNLRSQWDASHRSALDVGGGTGVMAQAVKTLFGLERIASVDVEDRFLPGLDVERSLYDGVSLPFPDSAFDCILLFNVLHHVPVDHRAALLRECRRVAGSGPIYIKDHLSCGRLDDIRLAALDLLGNMPFGGMLKARYLRDADWLNLARETGHDLSERLSGEYRRGPFEAVFPNGLEISMVWRPQ